MKEKFQLFSLLPIPLILKLNDSEIIRKSFWFFFLMLRHSAKNKRKGKLRDFLMCPGIACAALHKSDFFAKFVYIYFVYVRHVFNSNFS